MLIHLVEKVMPLVIVGIYVAVVLAAIMSTIDSLLVVASSAVVRDFYQQIFFADESITDKVFNSYTETFSTHSTGFEHRVYSFKKLFL